MELIKYSQINLKLFECSQNDEVFWVRLMRKSTPCI